MYFESLEAFLQMGRHGPYVWSAYGITLFLIGLNVWLARRRFRMLQAELARRARRERALTEPGGHE